MNDTGGDNIYRIKRTWKILISLFCTLLIFGGFIWLSNTTVTFEYVTIVKITSNSISLKNEGGRNASVSTSLDISKLVAVGQKYWVKYEYRKWQAPRLISIER